MMPSRLDPLPGDFDEELGDLDLLTCRWSSRLVSAT
jgi:hypothetical protein